MCRTPTAPEWDEYVTAPAVQCVGRDAEQLDRELEAQGFTTSRSLLRSGEQLETCPLRSLRAWLALLPDQRAAVFGA